MISQFHLDAEGSSAGERDFKNSKTRTSKSMRTEHSLAVARGEGRKEQGVTAHGDRVSFWGDVSERDRGARRTTPGMYSVLGNCSL